MLTPVNLTTIDSCGRNEFFDYCGTVKSCEASCKNPFGVDLICPDVCIQGCFCNNGFVRNQNRRCVQISSCTNGKENFF